ncbi:MAG: hypothetical protein Q7R33_05940, partial [Nitrosarchaeum sp.]|nr:hypothetical protein [Nitrosarchaeum sp.]
IDVESFKSYNKLSYNYGDKVLSLIGESLTSTTKYLNTISQSMRANHLKITVARWGGDEFLVLIECDCDIFSGLLRYICGNIFTHSQFQLNTGGVSTTFAKRVKYRNSPPENFSLLQIIDLLNDDILKQKSTKIGV